MKYSVRRYRTYCTICTHHKDERRFIIYSMNYHIRSSIHNDLYTTWCLKSTFSAVTVRIIPYNLFTGAYNLYVPVMHFRKVELQWRLHYEAVLTTLESNKLFYRTWQRGVHFKISLNVKNVYGTDPFLTYFKI